MAFTVREKAAEKALKRLFPTLIKSLNPDVRNELYARDMLTWHEQQTIGECIIYIYISIALNSTIVSYTSYS